MADSQRKTYNLFDKSTWDNVTATRGTVDVVANGIRLTATANDAYTQTYDNAEYSHPVTAGETYTLSWDIDNPNVYGIVYLFSGSTTGDTVLSNVVASAKKATFTIPNGHQYLSFRLGVSSSGDTLTYTNLMLNAGSTPLPYEPYWLHSLRKLDTSTDILTTLPADLYADGTNATVGLKGNMQQTGTPTPSSPIQPSETGERTGNLFDKSSNVVGYFISSVNGVWTRTGSTSRSILIKCEPNTTYTIFVPTNRTLRAAYFYNYPSAGDIPYGYTDNTTGEYVNKKLTITTSSSAQYLAFFCYNSAQEATMYDEAEYFSQIMLNTGSTPLPYEPWGIKIPISSANTTTPVYLGEVETTRKIKKLVLTGEEDWKILGNGFAYLYTITDYSKINGNISICTHFRTNDSVTAAGDVIDGVSFYNAPAENYRLYIKASALFTTVNELKLWLATQYTAGTPVTVWYVLATETTSIVNEPLRKIGDYADTVSGISIPTITGKDSFDVLTTLKPSEVSLAYTDWHDTTVKEWDGSQWQ